MENEITQDGAGSCFINNREKKDINTKKPKLLLFYKYHSNLLNIILTNKLDFIITQNHIEKRGKCNQLNKKSPRFKDNPDKWISSRLLNHRNDKINCLKDIDLFVWNKILKDIPKWAQVEELMNSYFNSIDLAPLYYSFDIIKDAFSTNLQEILFKAVTLSKNFPELSRAASNSISILSKLDYSLNDKDLQSVNIPYSDLSYTSMINANFQNGNLSFANFSQSSLYNVNFKNCNLEHAKFSSHLPFMNFKNIGASFDFSSCGRYFAAFGSENETIIRIWDIASNILIKEITVGDLKLLHLLRFSPSGQYITTTKAGALNLFDKQDDYKLITFEGFRKSILCFSFSSYETYIAAGSLDYTIRVWDLKSKEIIHNLFGHTREVLGLIFSPCNNFFYSVGGDSYILVWALRPKSKIIPHYKGKTFMYNKLKKGKKLLKRFIDESWVRSIALSNDGKFIISLSTNISVWNIKLGEKICFYSTSFLHFTASFNLNNLLAIRKDDGKILVFNIETQQFIYETYCEVGKGSNQLVFLPDGKSIAATSEARGISFFDISNVNYNKSIIKSNYTVNSISFSPCGKYFVTHCDEAKIELWDLTLHKFIKSIEGTSQNSAAKVVMYSFYGTYIATPNDRSIMIYSPDLEFLNKLRNRHSQIRALAISCDEKLIATGDIINNITVWKVKDLKKSILQIRQIGGTRNDTKYLGFSQNNEILISSSEDNKINIWKWQEPKCIKSFKPHKDSNIILQVFPSHQLMVYASGTSTKVVLYDLKFYAWVKEELICNASAPYKSLKFSPSGKYIAALSIKYIEAKPINEIYIWNVESKQLLNSFQESPDIITCFEFSYSENVIAVCIKNYIIKFWDWEKTIAI